ncbi:hypothetical protein [Shewanella maritima]|uniref:hypothetical protein n=1 Tax=Shewanella maritima TaxID=2520507 RepID=UPI003734CD7D
MNIEKSLKEDYGQKKVYLHDRPYHVFDVGEGLCNVVLVNKTGAEEIERITIELNGRLIIVDIAPAWGNSVLNMTKEQLDQLAEDIHLLVDIFWLEEVNFENRVSDLDAEPIYQVLKVRDYCLEQSRAS